MSKPACASSQEMTEFEFHISPVCISSGPTRGSAPGVPGGGCVARRRRPGSAAQGWRPPRRGRGSHRHASTAPRSGRRAAHAAQRLPTGPPATAPRRCPAPSGTGALSIVKRPSGTTTTRAGVVEVERATSLAKRHQALVVPPVQPDDVTAGAERDSEEIGGTRRAHEMAVVGRRRGSWSCIRRILERPRRGLNGSRPRRVTVPLPLTATPVAP